MGYELPPPPSPPDPGDRDVVDFWEMTIADILGTFRVPDRLVVPVILLAAAVVIAIAVALP